MMLKRVLMTNKQAIVLPRHLGERPHRFDVTCQLVPADIPCGGWRKPIETLAFNPDQGVLTLNQAVAIRFAFKNKLSWVGLPGFKRCKKLIDPILIANSFPQLSPSAAIERYELLCILQHPDSA